MTEALELLSPSAEATQEIGWHLGRAAQAGDIFLLSGVLGTGKTTLTQGIAWGLGVREHARSPTFVLVTQYAGRLPVYHIDLYRVDDVREALDLGLEEYLTGQGVCVVEWAEKASEAFPMDHLAVRLHYQGETCRRLMLTPFGPRGEALLREASPDLRAWTT